MPKTPPSRSRLDHFLHGNQLKPSHVARIAGCSRQQLLRLRRGRAAARITTAVQLAAACTRLLGRSVTLAELFDVEASTS